MPSVLGGHTWFPVLVGLHSRHAMVIRNFEPQLWVIPSTPHFGFLVPDSPTHQPGLSNTGQRGLSCPLLDRGGSTCVTTCAGPCQATALMPTELQAPVTPWGPSSCAPRKARHILWASLGPAMECVDGETPSLRKYGNKTHTPLPLWFQACRMQKSAQAGAVLARKGKYKGNAKATRSIPINQPREEPEDHVLQIQARKLSEGMPLRPKRAHSSLSSSGGPQQLVV